MKRIIGIDVARALAVIGMIFVNFKLVFGSAGNETLCDVLGLLEGKAAATFVVLAGVSIGLMTRSTKETNDLQKLGRIRRTISKRALFLFLVGSSYLLIWPADILHFYGIYMLITLFVLTRSAAVILGAAFVMIFIYPLLMLIWPYDQGWDFTTFHYTDFWTIQGFIRHLFYNGFHPVIPWTAFMLIGLWLGRQELHHEARVKRLLGISLIVFVLTHFLSGVIIRLLAERDVAVSQELTQILGTSPMPPLPIYMISGSSIAIAIIAFCILLAQRFAEHPITRALKKTGQLALTFYVAHVVLGMGLVEIISPESLGSYTITFSAVYSLLFSLGSILFAAVWLKYKQQGPLEWVMRRVTR